MRSILFNRTRYLILAGLVAALAGVPALADRDHDDDRGRGWLGVYLDGDSDQGDGIKIVSVIEDSPAMKAGLKNGDVIVRLNGVEIEDPERFFKEFQGLNPDDTVEIIVRRGGDEEQFEVILGQRDTGAIRIPHIRKHIRTNVPHYEFRPRGYLGVHLQGLTDDLREYFGVPEGEGVLVSQVEEDSPAEEAGFRAGDVITEANGERIEDAGDLMKALRGVEEGEQVEIIYYRDGRRDTADVTAGATEGRVLDVNSFIWCDEENDEDCSGTSSFSFEIDDDWVKSLEGLQDYFSSEDFQKRIQEYSSQYKDIERELERKMELLERKLREMEKQLQELHEKEEGTSRRHRRPEPPSKPTLA